MLPLIRSRSIRFHRNVLLTIALTLSCSPALAQSLADINNCTDSKLPLERRYESCSILIRSYVSLPMPAEERPKLVANRGVVNLLMKKYDWAIEDFNNAIALNVSDVSYLWQIDGKMLSLKMNAIALYGRGLAKLQKGDKSAADRDIAAAQNIKADIATWAFERFSIKATQ